jgi:hypothetical protein
MAESGNTQRALVICLWLHLGYIGAVALAVGLLQLLEGEPQWMSALALAFFGGVLAASSWRRGLATEPASAAATGAPRQSTARAPFGQSGSRAKGMLSLIPLQSNRKHDEQLRHSTPQ